jgi:hypothetical protein
VRGPFTSNGTTSPVNISWAARASQICSQRGWSNLAAVEWGAAAGAEDGLVDVPTGDAELSMDAWAVLFVGLSLGDLDGSRMLGQESTWLA